MLHLHGAKDMDSEETLFNFFWRALTFQWIVRNNYCPKRPQCGLGVTIRQKRANNLLHLAFIEATLHRAQFSPPNSTILNKISVPEQRRKRCALLAGSIKALGWFLKLVCWLLRFFFGSKDCCDFNALIPGLRSVLYSQSWDSCWLDLESC